MGAIKPQPGPQSKFLSSPADIAIYGGAAGGGKTWALEYEPIRHIGRSGFSAVIFRRNAVQVKNPGGLWDASMRLYPPLGGRALVQPMEWLFPSGAKIKFAHLEHEATVLDWQGAEITLICFDELTHFSRNQFFYMLSRNRSLCGITPYIRATCNPDSESWVADFINWWIDQESGLPIENKSGTLRWMLRDGDKIFWADSKEELKHEFGDASLPKSVTFISASLFDNKILMENDPGYLANLKALSQVERERLLYGNWKVRPASGLYFQRGWCQMLETEPSRLRQVRYWDLAATAKTENNDPDFTVGLKMGRDEAGRFYILHCHSLRASPHQVKKNIINIAQQDGKNVLIGLPQDPGQAGKAQVQHLAASLNGFTVKSRTESGSKLNRFSPFSAQCEAGNIYFIRGAWNNELFEALENFPDGSHDDHADACSGAYNILNSRPSMKINSSIITTDNFKIKKGSW